MNQSRTYVSRLCLFLSVFVDVFLCVCVVCRRIKTGSKRIESPFSQHHIMTSYPTTTSFNTTVSVGAQGGARIIGVHADAEAVMHRKKGFTRRMYVLQEIASRLGVKYQILTCKSRSCKLSTAKIKRAKMIIMFVTSILLMTILTIMTAFDVESVIDLAAFRPSGASQ